MKAKRKYKHQGPREASARERATAYFLSSGDSPSTACKKAGYSALTARRRSKQIIKRESVKRALLEIEAAIKPQELGRLSKARLHNELLTLPGGPKGAKPLLGYIRTAAEMDGLLGGPAELHLHNHPQNYPPIVLKMLAEKTAEILMERHGLTPEKAAELIQQKSGVSIDVEAIRPKIVEQIPAETPQPTPIEPPTPIETSLDRELEEGMERYKENYRRTYVPIWKQQRA